MSELIYVADETDLKRAGKVLSDLLPCPFCGGIPLTSTHQNDVTKNFVLKIFCPIFSCNGSIHICCKPEEVTDARVALALRWNKRWEAPS